MSGTQVSSFYPVNQLLQDNAQQITNYYAPRKNELLLQGEQQKISSNEMEVAARLAQGLLALPDETAMAAAYPNAVAYGQGLGFLKNAPSVFPGVDRLRQIASYGIPAEKQYEQQGVRSAADAIRLQLSGGGSTTTAAPGTTPPPLAIEGDAQARAAAVRDGLIKRGIDADTATAFAANALHESIANPNTGPGDMGASHGLFQWRADRFDRYQKIMGNVPDNAPLEQQLDFVVHELNTTEGAARDRIAAAQGPAAKAAAISQYYLRPKDVQAEMARRSATATQLQQQLTATTTPGTQTATTTQPQRTQVAAATPNTATDATTAPPRAPAATPAQPAATTTAQTTAPAQQPPAPPAAALSAPPPPRGADGLNAQQRQTVNGMLSTARTPAQLQQVQAQMQTYRDHNDTVQRQYQADVRQAQKDAEAATQHAQTQANDAERIRLQQEGLKIQQEDQAQKRRFQGAPTGMQWNDQGVLIRSPGYEGDKEDERIAYRLEHGDPSSPQYATDYAAMKWKMTPSGSYIENDMSQYRPPARSIQRPTYVPQPTGTMLDEVRKADTDARVIVPAIDHYVDVFKETGGTSWNAYFDNTADPKSQRLLGAFDALRTLLRSPTYYNTGVLQPAEMAMLKQDLVSPQTIRGLWATPQALEARLHEIKLTVLRRQDAELRSVGKEGVIVRNPAELARLSPGTVFYDEDGNKRQKPEAQ